MKEELLRLAERCEKAVFPCPDEASAMELVEIKSGICRLLFGRGYDAYSPDYTNSLDAAMSLVPEGYRGLYDETDADEGRNYTELFSPDERPTQSSCAKTLALSICAAALRASVKEQNNGG